VQIYLRNEIDRLLKEFNCNELLLADLKYCSDNAAMIGRVAIEQYNNNDFTNMNSITTAARVKGF